MSYLDDAIKQLHESDLALDGRIRRLEAAVAYAPDLSDAWHEQMKLMEADLGAVRIEANLLEEERDSLRRQLAEMTERCNDHLKRNQAMARFWEKLTDSVADSTSALAARFGNDLTWDELIAAAVERLDELDAFAAPS